MSRRDDYDDFTGAEIRGLTDSVERLTRDLDEQRQYSRKIESMLTDSRSDQREAMNVLRIAREALLTPSCTAATCAGQNCVSCRSGYDALSAIEDLLTSLKDKSASDHN